MTKTTRAVALSIIICVGSIYSAKAQPDFSKWQVGANVGAFIYQGDLTPSALGSYRTLTPGFGLYVSRVISPSIILRTNFTRATLHGNDAAYSSPAWRRQRNFSFSTPVTEITELVVWNVLKNNGNDLDRRFSPYLFAGAGVSLLKVSRNYSSINMIYFEDEAKVVNGLPADIATKPPSAMLVVPVGIGVEYYISPKISLTVESTFRYSQNDYLDGFSKSANPSKKDFYHSHTIGLVYKFAQKDRYGCPSAL